MSVAYLLMPVFCYTYYGDNRCAERFYEGCKAWTDYLLSRSRGYIMEYSYYGDWVEPAPDKVHTDNIFMSTVCLFWHLKLMSKIAEITGRVEVAANYAQKAEACAAAINEKYFDKSSCRYAGGTQTADAMALNLGIVPEFSAKKWRRPSRRTSLRADIIPLAAMSGIGICSARLEITAILTYS